MSSKSEQLCKLLGIEPKQIYDCTSMCEYYDEALIEEGCSLYLAGECSQEEYIYPDLTEPSNFVKLLDFARMLMFIRRNSGINFNYKFATVADINCNKYPTLQENFVQAFIWSIEEEIENFEDYESDKEIQEHLDSLKQANNIAWKL